MGLMIDLEEQLYAYKTATNALNNEVKRYRNIIAEAATLLHNYREQAEGREKAVISQVLQVLLENYHGNH